jgi:nucleoside-diphosphate-sugar epimerase
MKVVVTGGAGLVGSALRRRLGPDAIGMDMVSGPGVIAGDVTLYESCRAAFAGADVVVHTAALVAEQGSRAAFERLNVEGTRTVLQAAADVGVGRLVHVSSIVVHGAGGWTGDATEDAPVRPTGNPYTDTKIASEHLVLAAAARQPVVVVRPGDVYGPGSRQWTLRPTQLMAKGQFALVGGGRGILSPVHVDDLARGIAAAVEVPGIEGQIFHLCGPGVSAREYFGCYADLLGIKLRSVPRPLALVAGRLTSALGSLPARFGWEPPLTTRTLEYLEHPGGYSTARAREQLDWRPSVYLADGIAGCAPWLREQGLPL